FINNLPISVLFITVIEMTTFFHITLRPFLILSKCIGLIDITYTMEPTGLLLHTINSINNSALYNYDSELFILQAILVMKFWTNILAARLSNNWIIEFINGMIEFDQKLRPILTNLQIQQRSLSKNQWVIFLTSIFVYHFGFIYLHRLIRPLKDTEYIFTLVNFVFSPPFILDYVVISCMCFFLHNLYTRFWMLNDVWKCLPAELVVDHDQWTHVEIVFFMERIRLLHSELCELLKKFTLGFGPLLLAFFTFSYIVLLIALFFMISIHPLSSENFAEYILDAVFNLLLNSQLIIFMMSIIVYVSLIDKQRTKIISYLRSYRISNLNMDVKKQIKMFMNQMSVSGLDQITAFGFFNINLNLVMSILVLIITGITTLLQMKNHSIILRWKNDTNSYIQHSTLNYTLDNSKIYVVIDSIHCHKYVHTLYTLLSQC
ncbi:Gustatory receptor, partial [Aphis craccivora]